MTEKYSYLFNFINSIDVACPKCGAHAIVVTDKTTSNTKFTCNSCGKNDQWEGLSNVYQTSKSHCKKLNYIVLGKPFDCYFKHPLWFKFDFKGAVFFAYNKEHLAFLKEYIADPLRKRRQNEFGWSNSSLQSRLPKWILSAGNRDSLLKKIEILEKK